MAIVKFELIKECKTPIVQNISLEHAKIHARIAVLCESFIDECFNSEADNFFELSEVPVAKTIDRHCIASAPFRDESSVYIDGDCTENTVSFIHYTIKQDCLYFANGVPFEDAIYMAAVAAVSGDVEQSVDIQCSAPQRLDITAPEEIPISVLAEAYGTQIKAYSPAVKKEAAV